MTAPRRSALLLLLFTALTLVMTYPQVASISNAVPYHTDPYFSMWRLAWVASRVVHAPLRIFDANIFFSMLGRHSTSALDRWTTSATTEPR